MNFCRGYANFWVRQVNFQQMLYLWFPETSKKFSSFKQLLLPSFHRGDQRKKKPVSSLQNLSLHFQIGIRSSLERNLFHKFHCFWGVPFLFIPSDDFKTNRKFSTAIDNFMIRNSMLSEMNKRSWVVFKYTFMDLVSLMITLLHLLPWLVLLQFGLKFRNHDISFFINLCTRLYLLYSRMHNTKSS